MNMISKVIIGLGLALILGYFGWQKLSETTPAERKTPEIALATEAPLTPTTSESVMDKIWHRVSVEWMPWSALLGGFVLLTLIGSISSGADFFKSRYFWIPVCLLVVGGLGYHFRNDIWNWGVGLVSTSWWSEMMPLWIIIAVSIVLIFLFWLIGKDKFGSLVAKIIGLTAIVFAAWFILTLIGGFIRALPSVPSMATSGGQASPQVQVQSQETVKEFTVLGKSTNKWLAIDVATWIDITPEHGKTVIAYAQSISGEGPQTLDNVYAGRVPGKVTYLTDTTDGLLGTWLNGKIFLISADEQPVMVRCTSRN